MTFNPFWQEYKVMSDKSDCGDDVAHQSKHEQFSIIPENEFYKTGLFLFFFNVFQHKPLIERRHWLSDRL